jgi:protein-disulfide isomerase
MVDSASMRDDAKHFNGREVLLFALVALLTGFIAGRLTSREYLDLSFLERRPESIDFALEVPGPIARDSEILPTADAPFLGPGTAKVTLVEFSDFQCPYCTEAVPVIHDLLNRFGGDVRLVYRNFPLGTHEHAHLAAQAALAAASQGRFWEYHDVLFAHSDALDRASLGAYAEELGLDMDVFRRALDGHAYAEQVETDRRQALALGVHGTPTFFVNGTLVTGALTDRLEALTRAEIEAADALLDDGVPLDEIYRRRVAENFVEPAPGE